MSPATAPIVENMPMMTNIEEKKKDERALLPRDESIHVAAAGIG